MISVKTFDFNSVDVLDRWKFPINSIASFFVQVALKEQQNKTSNNS